jgi:phage protein D
MKITINITDKKTIEEMKAVGAQDLKDFFLPEKMNIKAKSVEIAECTKENREKMWRGEEYTHYLDKSA